MNALAGKIMLPCELLSGALMCSHKYKNKVTTVNTAPGVYGGAWIYHATNAQFGLSYNCAYFYTFSREYYTSFRVAVKNSGKTIKEHVYR